MNYNTAEPLCKPDMSQHSDHKIEPGSSDSASEPGAEVETDCNLNKNTGIQPAAEAPPSEIGGRDGLEPTRYGDWEKNGRCIDF